MTASTHTILSQLHIDMARNATDDFNLFHDANRWQLIKDNPFKGPIALGFQLGLFIESQIERAHAEEEDIEGLRFSVFELNFANPVRSGDALDCQIKSARETTSEQGMQRSRRVVVKTNGKPAIIGFHRGSSYPTVINPNPHKHPGLLSTYFDRTFIAAKCFYKRKWMIVGNAKNFLLSACADQTVYVDEFADKVSFPKMYPLALTSSALLERALAMKHDVIGNPLIYTSHNLCIDNDQASSLKSNDCLQMLVTELESDDEKNVLLNCTGWVRDSDPLFCTELALRPLSAI